MTPAQIASLMKFVQAKGMSFPTVPRPSTAPPRASGNYDLSKGNQLGPETYRDLFRTPSEDAIAKYYASTPNATRTTGEQDALNYQLSLAKKFDPNASIVNATEQSSDGYTEGFNPGVAAHVQYDKSLMPKPVAGNGEFVLADHNTNVNDKNGVVFDPNYGWITYNQNVKANNNPMWKVAPMLPALVGTFMGMPTAAGLLSSGVKTAGSVLSGNGVNPFQIAKLGASIGSGMGR